MLPALLILGAIIPAVHAQTPTPGASFAILTPEPLPATPSAVETSSSEAASTPAAALPDAPLPQLATEPKPKAGTDPAAHIARKSTKVIPSDWHAQPLTARDKVKVGVDGIFSIENFTAIVLAAGFEQLDNGEPNFGTDKGAFGERVGAAALRNVTQGAFTDMVFAPLLHEDPRYYVEGPRFSPVHRGLYALTRPLITRKDDGSKTVNGSLLLGYAAAAALTPAYYPRSNRNFHDAASVYGGSLGGAALGSFLTEFSEDLLRSLHLSHTP